jgi:hypothetical protein
MAQFISYNPNIEVAGVYVFSFINSMRRDIEYRQDVLARHGIVAHKDHIWYPLQAFLDAMKEIGETTGEMNLFIMGLSAIKNTPILANTNLKDVLAMTNNRIHSLHRLDGKPMYNAATGEKLEGLGNLVLTEFDDINGTATITSDSPYPSKTEEGVFTGRLQQYKPTNSEFHQVKEDITQPRKSQGGDSTTFILRW